MQQKPSLFHREMVTSAFWVQEKEKWSRKCLLVKTALEWLLDQKNTLLYRDAEGNSSLDFMADILQQKGGRTKPNLKSTYKQGGNVTRRTWRKLSHLS